MLFSCIKSFRISGFQLLSLSFEYLQGRVCKVDIFAPNLTYFRGCWGVGSLVLFNELNLPFLNIVDVHGDGTWNGQSRHVPGIISMLQAFHNAQFVKLCCDTVQVSSSSHWSIVYLLIVSLFSDMIFCCLMCLASLFNWSLVY